MKKTLWAIIIIVIIVVLGGILFTKNSSNLQTDKTAIKVGVIIPLTGDLAIIGEELKKGIDLAISELQFKGLNITAIYEDDRFDPKVTATAANKLLNIDKVNFAVTFSIEEARPIVSIFNDHKVPLVVTWDSNIFLQDASPYIYSNGFSTEKAGEIMADYAFAELNLRNVAMLSHVDAWSEIISESFAEQFKKNGGNIIYSDTAQVGTNDFRLQISKIKAQKTDGVYFPLLPFDSVSFIKQAKELKLNVPLMSGDALIQDVIDAAGNAADGIYYTNAYSGNTQLSNLYRSKYEKDPFAIVFVESGYDALMRIGQSIDSSGDIKSALDKVFGSSRSASKIEKIYQVKEGISNEVK